MFWKSWIFKIYIFKVTGQWPVAIRWYKIRGRSLITWTVKWPFWPPLPPSCSRNMRMFPNKQRNCPQTSPLKSVCNSLTAAMKCKLQTQAICTNIKAFILIPFTLSLFCLFHRKNQVIRILSIVTVKWTAIEINHAAREKTRLRIA